MSRYINIDDVGLRKTIAVGGLSAKALWRRIQEEPSIDIVRCKECKWGKPYSDKQLECDALGLGGLKFPDDFCSYGESKDKCKECWYWSEVHERCENKGGCQFKPYGERREP